MKNGIKYIIILAMPATILIGCSSKNEWARVHSPDGQAAIIVSSKDKHMIQMPGPEPPRTLSRKARFLVEVKGRKVHDTGYKDVGVYQSIPNAFDVAWSPDSDHVAYRLITTLRIVSRDGSVYQPDAN
ncbi:MAG TPA: hypothetical protein PLW02_05570 [Verrucomicrobiota bacterium]|nr:hypothetical protein [Verrucomicrobiota bacterium]